MEMGIKFSNLGISNKVAAERKTSHRILNEKSLKIETKIDT
jgi:hypothetical protein